MIKSSLQYNGVTIEIKGTEEKCSKKLAPHDGVDDIIDCIIKFDETETVEKKARYFDIIQKDLIAAREEK